MDFRTQTNTELKLSISAPEGVLVTTDEGCQTSKSLTQEQFQAMLKELFLVRSSRSK